MRVREFLKILIAIAFPILLIVLLAAYYHEPSAPEPPLPPIININLKDATLGDFNINPKSHIYATDSLELTIGQDTTTYYDVTIKGHGNSTWYEDKKPFQITFSTKTTLFGFAPAKKYILLADTFDSSHLKNSMAFYIEHLLDQEYALSGEYVNLYFNHEYYGLYYLTEKVEINKNRIALSDQSAVLVEHEGLHAHLETSECYRSLQSICLVLKDINEPDFTKDAMDNFLDKFKALERASAERDFSEVETLIDVDSFAKYYLLSNLSLNPDAFMSSYFFYQDGPDDKIHVGPGWDFDLAFGAEPTWGVNYGLNFFSPYRTNADTLDEITTRPGVGENGESESLIMYHLIRIPEFKNRVTEIYLEKLSDRSIEIINHFNTTASFIRPSALEDNAKWNFQDYDTSVDKVRDWLRDRLDYLYCYYTNAPAIPIEDFFIL